MSLRSNATTPVFHAPSFFVVQTISWIPEWDSHACKAYLLGFHPIILPHITVPLSSIPSTSIFFHSSMRFLMLPFYGACICYGGRVWPSVWATLWHGWQTLCKIIWFCCSWESSEQQLDFSFWPSILPQSPTPWDCSMNLFLMQLQLHTCLCLHTTSHQWPLDLGSDPFFHCDAHLLHPLTCSPIQNKSTTLFHHHQRVCCILSCLSPQYTTLGSLFIPFSASPSLISFSWPWWWLKEWFYPWLPLHSRPMEVRFQLLLYSALICLSTLFIWAQPPSSLTSLGPGHGSHYSAYLFYHGHLHELA